MAQTRLWRAVALVATIAAGDLALRWIGLPWPSAGALLIAPALADDDDDDDKAGSPGRASPPRRPTPREIERPRPKAAPAPRTLPTDLDTVVPGTPRRARPREAQPPAQRRELVAAGLGQADLARVRAAGFVVVATRSLGILPTAVARLRIPARLSESQGLARLRQIVPAATADFNHLYRPGAQPCPPEVCFRIGGPGFKLAGACALGGTIGMIDTPVDTAHPALAGRTIAVETVRGEGRARARTEHGTEIAIVLTAAAQADARFELVAVDAFHRRGNEDYADAFDIAAAIDRLAARNVSVANLSFTGPANALLERAGAALTERGAIVVAAAGNDGPTAPPRYPAAYSWAVAVTAVDRRDRVFPRAVRGPHVAFAAAGVRVQMPNRALEPGPVRSGTSYAAPHVTAAIAAARAADPAASRAAILEALAQGAKDLGAPGRDPVFGWGLIAGPRPCTAP